MRILFCLCGMALVVSLTSCATSVFLAGKAATFVLKTGVNVAWKVAAGIGKIGTKEAVHAIDLTADAAIQVLAQRESQRLVEKFWLALQSGYVDAAYRLFSDELKRQFKKRAFADYVNPWAGHIAAYELLDLTVRQFHVEVPTQIFVGGAAAAGAGGAAAAPGAKVGVTVYVSNVNDRWQITGWEADKGR